MVKSNPPLPCIFCHNPRTTKLGEHVWDDWINRKDGKEIRQPSTTFHYGVGGRLIREHPSSQITPTADVVCDECNNRWMSEITNRTKNLLENIIRNDEPRDFDTVELVTLAAFAFMKSAVLDWHARDRRRIPCISRTACLAFRNSFLPTATGDIAFPDGFQVWIARYRRKHVMEAQAFSEEMTGARQFEGYIILVTTYIIGSFIFQSTCPRWSKPRRNRPETPFFHIINDTQSVRVWPGVHVAYWPPPTHIDGSNLEAFRERFRRVRIIRNT